MAFTPHQGLFIRGSIGSLVGQTREGAGGKYPPGQESHVRICLDRSVREDSGRMYVLSSVHLSVPQEVG